MSTERPRDIDSIVTRAFGGASGCLRGCSGELVVRALFLLGAGAVGLGMRLLIQYMGVPLTLASLFVLTVILLEFWPRAPHPERSRWRWLYYGPIAGLIVSVCYAIYLGAQDSEDVGWWALVAGGMLVLLGLASKVDRWLRRETA
ncbi:MAG TPA: hypothetical protein VEY08_02715 [Chloroflexia bacterium]|nr:hypothetical protein [Chloroflexia bacterium]